MNLAPPILGGIGARWAYRSFCLPYVREVAEEERDEQLIDGSSHSQAPSQMGAWRNEFICIAMDVATRFNICINLTVGWQVIIDGPNQARRCVR